MSQPSVNPFWTAARGEQIINCELVTADNGQVILRCGYGPRAVVRSQSIPCADAAADLAATWKNALLEQGFHIVFPE